jgi:hypothetical protein
MPANKSSQRKKETISDQQPEEQLFLEAMKGVNPIARDHARELASVEANVERKLEDNPIYIPKNEALSQLVRLVNHGEGFIVSDTPEYREIILFKRILIFME